MPENTLNGMLDVCKERGYTSNDAVAKLRGILHMKKIGHTGTLDPEAEGVLPVCLCNGTKLVSLIEDTDKEYSAVLRLGITTDTQDLAPGAKMLSSVPDEEVLRKVTPEMVRQTAGMFVGEISQVPPMYSAVRVNGKRLYELAREGKTVERAARTIRIYEIEITDIDLPHVTMRVRCSKGTYIRTLCNDIGERLGVGGVMEHLVRTRVGMFRLENAVTLGELEERMKRAEAEGKEKYAYVRSLVQPVEAFFSECPAVRTLKESDVHLRNGNALAEADLTEGRVPESADGRIRVYDSQGVFTAVYGPEPGSGKIRPVKMFL